MAQLKHRVDMKQSKFPMISTEVGETVLVSNTRSASSAETSNTPQVMYCHNVVPSVNSMDSVDFAALIPAAAPAVTSFIDGRDMNSDLGSPMKIAFNTGNAVYAIKPGEATWTLLSTPGVFDPEAVTIGTVNGVSYIWFPLIGCFQFDEGAGDLASVVLTGISIPNTIGLVGSSGYLLAYTNKATAWSSTIDPTDFTPSEVTGAGGGNVDGIGGDIIFAAANDLGVIYYCEKNAIAATYTGNIQFPFKFKEVRNSKGCISQDLAATEVNSAEHYIFSPAGMQEITPVKARTVLPEVTDFLGGKVFEDFNETTNQIEQTDLVTTLKKKVKFIAGRYLIISYGITEFTHALIYDVSLEKMGKVKITHVDCFEFVGSQQETSKESIAFMDKAGAISVIDSSDSVSTSGVLLLGRYQYSRTRYVTLHEIRSSNIRSGASYTVHVLHSLDGEGVESITSFTEAVANDRVREHKGMVTGKNHSILLKGRFTLSNLVVSIKQHGRR